jgi:hypothetical protein
VRAMCTHPRFARSGVGRLVLSLCEQAAAAEGFARVELAATMAGRFISLVGIRRSNGSGRHRGGVRVPMVRMGKQIV